MSFLTEKPKPKEERIKIVLRDDSKKSKPQQIVTSEQAKNKKRDPKAKFLSKKNQTFDKQMTAKTTGAFKAAGKGNKNGRKKAAQKQQKQAPQIATRAVKKPKKTKNGRKQKKKISFADLAVGQKIVKAKPRKKRAAASLSSLGLKHGNKKNSGLSANNDFVEDVPLGDMTRLNTVEYKYYGFYHRIKQKLEQYWGNTIQKKALALWKSGRRLPASKNRITSLEIIIDNKGNIVKINVQGSSGVKELDEAAIESFNRAGPFPNPPSGMMKNGIAKIKWGFVVKG
ncbi:MAG: energy transducer TonB [Halobacteriovoraceae bacterium]|nr:energy transducer TonB [Halobacteriovoraceae bacterium]